MQGSREATASAPGPAGVGELWARIVVLFELSERLDVGPTAMSSVLLLRSDVFFVSST